MEADDRDFYLYLRDRRISGSEFKPHVNFFFKI